MLHFKTMIGTLLRSLIRPALLAVAMLAGTGLTACGSLQTFEAAPLVLPQPVKPNLPRPSVPNLVPIHWVVVTPQTIAQLPKGSHYFYMALTEKDYEALAENQSELLRYKTDGDWLLGYYEGTNPPWQMKPVTK